MTNRTEYQKNYYAENKEALFEKREKQKTFNELLQEFADSRTLAEVEMLQEVMSKDMTPDHIALLWREYQRATNAVMTIATVNEHKRPFIDWMELR
ncbi:hypothetical protein AB4526_16925 [Vibrio cyclitrophicus]